MLEHRRIYTLCLGTIALACADPSKITERSSLGVPSSQSVPRAVSASAVSTDPKPAWTIVDAQSTNFSSDGRGDYVSGTCGLTGSIYYSNYDPANGVGGDATLDNTGNGSKKPLCARRSIRVTLNGAVRDVPFINVRRVLTLNVGETHTQNFQMWVSGDSQCERLAWHSELDGGAGGQIVVTRDSVNKWSATTIGPARCFYYQGTTQVWTDTYGDVQASFVIRQR